jgi:hypothetical protein
MTTVLISRRVLTPLAILLTTTTAFAAEMDMGKGKSVTMPMAAMTPATAYRFEQAAAPKNLGGGKSLVAIKLMHDGKPVTGAIIIQSRADMAPIGMGTMTAPIKPLGEQPAGVYRFEVSNGPVWKKPDPWAISVSAKVQGVTQTVTGSVTVNLTP